jgi:hypothetical protein
MRVAAKKGRTGLERGVTEKYKDKYKNLKRFVMGTGSFPGVESGRGVTLTPDPLLVPRSKNRVELYLYSPQGPSWPVKRVKPTYKGLSV